jgi:hypothetical protein
MKVETTKVETTFPSSEMGNEGGKAGDGLMVSGLISAICKMIYTEIDSCAYDECQA